MMHVVLLEPEIPQNAGNVARLCAATGACLHLIEPFGFKLDDKQLKRAGMDYWQWVAWRRWASWQAFVDAGEVTGRLWFVESGGGRRYSDVRYAEGDALVFGRETAGLPRSLIEANAETWIRIPMFHEKARSLNLSNCVALTLYEALRQRGFNGELG